MTHGNEHLSEAIRTTEVLSLRQLSTGRWTDEIARRAQVQPSVLLGLSCAVVFFAPLEGYLSALQADLAKLPSAMLAAAWVVWRIQTRHASHPVHVGSVFFVLLGSIVLASAGMSLDGPFTMTYTVRWLSFITIAYVLYDVLSTVVRPRYVLLAYLAGAFIAACGAIFSFTVLADARATGPMEDPNDLAYTLVAAIPFVLLIDAETLRPLPKIRYEYVQGVAAAVLLAGAGLTFSRGGALGLSAALLILLVLGGHLFKARMLICLAAIVLIGAAGLAVASSSYLVTAFEQKTYIADTNVETRTLRWTAATEMLGTNPLFGVGPGGFRSEYTTVSDNAEPAESSPVAHEMYLETGAELGGLGLLVFLGLCGRAVLAMERARRSAGRVADLPIAALASFAAILVASIFLSEQYYMPLWLMLAGGFALEVRARRTLGWRPAR